MISHREKLFNHMLIAATLTTIFVIRAAVGCPDEEGCTACSVPRHGSHRMCLFCYRGFVDDNDECDRSHLLTIDHCISYVRSHWNNNIPFCITCELGYRRSKDRKECIPCSTSGCAICEDDRCTGCFDGRKLLFLDDLSTRSQCMIDESCELPNCQICEKSRADLPTTCAICKPGFALTDKDTTNCIQSQVLNCQSLSEVDKSQCTFCDFGYHSSALGRCQKDSNRHDDLTVLIIAMTLDLMLGVYLGWLVLTSSGPL